MLKTEADRLMVERFSELGSRAENAENTDELIRITDCMHKLYITLINAGAFDGAPMSSIDTGLKN